MTATAAPTVRLSLREFVDRGFLVSDRAERLQPSPLLAALVDALEDSSREVNLVCPRRAGKSSAVAQVLAHALLCRPLSFSLCVAGSADQMQDVVEQKLRRPLSLLPSTRESLTFARDRITCPRLGSTVQVVPSSEATSPGRTVDLLVVDEARSVPEEGWEVLRPSAAGGTIVALGSPGSRSHWWYRACCEPSPRAKVIHFTDSTACNPMLSAEFIESERARLAKRGAWGQAIFRREWQAEWTEISECPLVSPADVEACSRPPEEVEPFDAGLGDRAFTGVDLSLTGDLTTIVTVARRGEALRVADMQVLDPKSFVGGTISFDLVAERIESVWRRFRPRKVALDAYQGVALAQGLQALGVPVEPVHVTSLLNMECFGALVEAIGARRLVWPRHRRLEQELLNLEVKESLGGWTVRDREARFHRDVSFSLALAVRE